MERNLDYNERYIRFSKRIERGIILLIGCVLLLLLAGETICQFDPVRRFLTETVRLEGIPHTP